VYPRAVDQWKIGGLLNLKTARAIDLAALPAAAPYLASGLVL
jgi:hypothetical protein